MTRLPGGAILLVAAAVVSLSLASSASAASIVVDTPVDPNGAATDCTLRDALASANTDDPVIDSDCTEGDGNDTITFAAGALPLIGGRDEFVVTSNVTIQGPGAGQLAIDGDGGERVFHVTAGSATITGLTIRDGLAITGGGVRVESGAALSLDLVVISGNQAVHSSSGSTDNEALASGGGIHSEGVLSINRSTIIGNTASAVAIGQPGATSNYADSRGGGISSPSGQLMITRSTIEGNTASASATGAGTKTDRGLGGGVQVSPAVVAPITLSTIVDNSAGSVATAGASEGGAVSGGAGTTLVSDTITSNASHWAYVAGNSISPISIQNTVIASAGSNCIYVESNGHNVSSDNSCDQEADDRGSTNPHLLPIGDYGGPTRSRPPEEPAAATFTAIDGGVAAGHTTDQRGHQRQWLFDTPNGLGASDGTDIGAVEIQGPTNLESTPSSPGNASNPTISGDLEPTGALLATLYRGATCTTFVSGGPGFNVGGLNGGMVQPDTMTSYTATSFYGNATSACSDPFTYIRRPTAPALGPTDPVSGSNDNTPKIKGTAPLGSPVNIYTNPACAGAVAGTGSQGDLVGPGILLNAPVADNSTTTFYATAAGAHATSSCSSGITYREVTPAPRVVRKKCRKGFRLTWTKKKGKKKRKRCVRRNKRKHG